MENISVEEAFECFMKNAVKGRTREMAIYGRIFIERVVDLCFSCHGIIPSVSQKDLNLFEKIDYIQNNTRWLSPMAINAVHSIRKDSNMLIHCKVMMFGSAVRQGMKENCELAACEFLKNYASVLPEKTRSGIRAALEEYGTERITHRQYEYEINREEVQHTQKNGMKYNAITICAVLSLLIGSHTIGRIPGTIDRRYDAGTQIREWPEETPNAGWEDWTYEVEEWLDLNDWSDVEDWLADPDGWPDVSDVVPDPDEEYIGWIFRDFPEANGQY